MSRRRSSRTFCSCSVLLTILLIVFPAMRGNTQDSVESIVSALRSQRWDDALAAAESSLKTNPRDYRLWTFKGMALSRKGEIDAAYKSFQTALALSPKNVGVLRAEASMFYDAGDKRALPVLQKIVEEDPADKTARDMLAVAAAKQDACNVALPQFQLIGETVASHPASL